jgi:uncharacterized protein YdhG (YjbR/CyaY superfamily)
VATAFASFDDYIDSFSGVTKERLVELRSIAGSVLPAAEEGISYNTAAYRHDGAWVAYISGFAKHVSLALGGRIDALAAVFAEELSPYKVSASAIQFRHNEPLPHDLIRRIIEHRRDVGLK